MMPLDVEAARLSVHIDQQVNEGLCKQGEDHRNDLNAPCRRVVDVVVRAIFAGRRPDTYSMWEDVLRPAPASPKPNLTLRAETEAVLQDLSPALAQEYRDRIAEMRAGGAEE